MDMAKEIAKEHSRNMAVTIAEYIGTDADRFQTLIELYLIGPCKITHRCSYALSLCVEFNPSLLVPHLVTVLTFLKSRNKIDGITRNTLRAIHFCKVPKKYNNALATICFDTLLSAAPVAVQVFAMQLLIPIVNHDEILKEELIRILTEKMPRGSAGFKSRARKTLEALY
jgi:hypothetical protein